MISIASYDSGTLWTDSDASKKLKKAIPAWLKPVPNAPVPDIQYSRGFWFRETVARIGNPESDIYLILFRVLFRHEHITPIDELFIDLYCILDKFGYPIPVEESREIFKRFDFKYVERVDKPLKFVIIYSDRQSNWPNSF